jgi:hypothetical protein
VRFQGFNFLEADDYKLYFPYKYALEPMWLCFALLQMTRYKQADFEDDSSSVGSVQLREGVSANTTHIRYHTVSAAQFLNTPEPRYNDIGLYDTSPIASDMLC